MDSGRERARQPEDLSRLLAERANAGDLEGMVALYEPGAVLAYLPVTRRQAIRRSASCMRGCSPRDPASHPVTSDVRSATGTWP